MPFDPIAFQAVLIQREKIQSRVSARLARVMLRDPNWPLSSSIYAQKAYLRSSDVSSILNRHDTSPVGGQYTNDYLADTVLESLYQDGGGRDPSYTSKVLSTDWGHLLFYYPMGEPSGTVAYDLSQFGNNGSYKGVGEPLLAQSPGVEPNGLIPLFDGTNDYLNVYSSNLASIFNGNEGTACFWLKVSAVGVWTDATFRSSYVLQIDASNLINLRKSTTNGQFDLIRVGSGTTKTHSIATGSPTGWIHLALTWSKSADAEKAYLNGSQSGATQTGLANMVGTLTSTTCAVGAANTTGGAPTSGYVAHAALWNTVLSASQIAALAVPF